MSWSATGTITVATYDDSVDYTAVSDSLPHPLRSGICSKFLCVGSSSQLLLQALHHRGSPAISLGHDAALPGVLSIIPDYAQASKQAIEHLGPDGGPLQAAVLVKFVSNE